MVKKLKEADQIPKEDIQYLADRLRGLDHPVADLLFALWPEMTVKDLWKHREVVDAIYANALALRSRFDNLTSHSHPDLKLSTELEHRMALTLDSHELDLLNLETIKGDAERQRALKFIDRKRRPKK